MNNKDKEKDFKDADLDQDKVETEQADQETEQKNQSQDPEQEAEVSAEAKPEEKQEENFEEKWLRVTAEYQNYRRRTEQEKKDIYAFASEKIATDLLDVIDNFERAMDAKPDNDKFAEGIELILKQLKGVLDKNNVKEIEALGKPFDPKFHNAVMTEDAQGAESGTVTKVLQKGYMLNDKVIRPSMVAVAK